MTENRRNKPPNNRGTVGEKFKLSRLLLLALLFLGAGFIISTAAPARASVAGDPPAQVYYLSEPEDHQYAAFDPIYSGTPSTTIQTYTSITIGTNNTIVYYDHWENGFVANIANPSPSEIYSNPGNLGGLQIWGDNNPANGAPPTGDDILNKGEVIILANIVDSTNLGAIDFDGRDKIGATDAVAVTRASWPTDPGSVEAFGNALFPTSDWGTAYTAPVGCNTTISGASFEYAAISLIASRDGTVIDIDANADGTYETSVTLNEGQSYLVNNSYSGDTCNAVRQGAKVRTLDATKPFQAHLLTGNLNSGVETRDFNMVPDAQRSNDYWIPVGRADGSDPTRLYFYNPGPGTLHVKCEVGAGGGTILRANSIAPGGVGSVDLTDNQGAHCYAVTASNGNTVSTQVFSGVGAVDNNSTTYDWGFPLIPTSALSNQALVGWAPGRQPPTNATENGSPIWVTATCSTWLYVDWNNNGTSDDVDFNGDGDTSDPDVGGFLFLDEGPSNNGINIPAGQSIRLFDPDGDQTGAYIYTKTANNNGGTGGCTFAAAWGEDPDTADTGNPYMDLGTIIIPLKGVQTSKASFLLTDADGDGLPGPGDTLRYTISIKNVGFSPVDVSVYDTIPANTTYVAGSTFKFTPGPGGALIPDSGSGTLFPLDDNSPTGVALGSLPVGVTWTAQFNVTLNAINPPSLPDYNDANNCAKITYGSSNTATCVTTGIVKPLVVNLVKTADPTNVVPGNNVTYTIKYWNVDQGPLTDVATNLTVTDNLNVNLSFVSATPTGAGTCVHTGATPGGTVTCTGLPNPGKGTPPNTPYGVITLVAKVEKNAVTNVNGFQLPNTATVCGYGATRPTIQKCDDDTVTITTPVTVAYFMATPTGDGTRFEWGTESETANAGFNLYVQTVNGLEKVNDELIPTQVIDSQEPQDYSYDAPGVSGETFFIEDVGLFGENRFHGPFTAGQPYGERVEREPIDWTAIAAESEALAAQSVETMATPLGTDAAVNRGAVELRVKTNGIYRLTYEQIQAAGVDLNGVTRTSLALTSRGEPVPIYVSKTRFGPGAYIEFVGEGLDTLYTDTNVYRLEVNPALVSRMVIQRTRPTRSALSAGALPTYYMETNTVEANKVYSYVSPTGDPWFDTFMHSALAKIWKYTLNVDNYVSGAAPATLNVSMWGASDMIAGPDHHTLVALNGQQVADEIYDEVDVINVSVQLPTGALQEGANELMLTQPLDRGAPADVSGLESYGVVYPRAFVARDGRLTFEGKAAAFKVSNLPNQDVVVYRMENDSRLVKLTGLIFTSGVNGTYDVAFKGTAANARYYVSTVSALSTAPASAARAPGNLTGEADLLVIAHPNFIDGLAPWLQVRQAQGFTTKVVDVRDVYAAYSFGILDAQAIAQYIRNAITFQGVEYVVLVGGDTYDYRNYLGQGSISFIPSLYANTIRYINFAPVDPLYTDVNGDKVPDAAIGRFPVRTTAELQLMVDKTLLYDARANVQTAIFAADAGFEPDSDAFASALDGWTVGKAYVTGQGGTAAARGALIAALNQGPRLASFVGHSGLNHWTFAPLFTANDAAALTNVNAPSVITQWGCWNTYFVDPAYNTLGHKFLLSGMNGAAAVTGASTLTNSSSERALGVLMMPKVMTPGTTLGAAMQGAKAELALSHPEMRDVLLGWTVLGDPTLVVRP